MKNIHSIVNKAKDDLFPELEAKIRNELEKKDKDWLIDQIILLTCERHSLHEQNENSLTTKKFINRIKRKNYTDKSIEDFITKHQNTTRKYLESSGTIINAPHMGMSIIEPQHLSFTGKEILEEAKEILYVLLFGDNRTNTYITREQEELLIMTLPEEKSDCLSFLKAVTEIKCAGTWKDPDEISNDEHTNNIELHVEFGDNKNQTNSKAVFIALNLLNLLFINEQIFYARITKVEQSSLNL